jgi:peptidoglycan/LPS O-acetylase OafA/YrhL
MIRRLLYLNGLAIIGVILFHAAGWGFVAMIAWTPRYLPVVEPVFDQVGSLSYYWLRFIEQLVVVVIPIFLFVSGYFVAFSAGKRHTLSWTQIWGRVKALLIPYVLWTLLFWVLWLPQGIVYSPLEYLAMFLTGKTTEAYYYVPLLIQFYVLSPLLVPLARNHWKWLLLGTGLIQIGLQLAQTAVMLQGPGNVPDVVLLVARIPKWLFLARLFWFSLGIVVGFHLAQFKQMLAKVKTVSLVTAVLLIPLGMIEWVLIVRYSGENWLPHRETLLDSVYALAVLFAFFGYANVKLPANKTISDWGAKSFGIYLAHIPVMEFTARAIYTVAPGILRYQIILQPALIVLGLGIPLLMMAVMDRRPFRRY